MSFFYKKILGGSTLFLVAALGLGFASVSLFGVKADSCSAKSSFDRSKILIPAGDSYVEAQRISPELNKPSVIYKNGVYINVDGRIYYSDGVKYLEQPTFKDGKILIMVEDYYLLADADSYTDFTSQNFGSSMLLAYKGYLLKTDSSSSRSVDSGVYAKGGTTAVCMSSIFYEADISYAAARVLNGIVIEK
ncbi:MAG: hypothetical protein WC107_00680 [Patescibacteria group bacterium]